MKSTFFRISVIALFLAGCSAVKQSASTVVDPTTATVESVTSVISGVTDDQAGSSYAVRSQSWKTQALLPAAFASSCTRPVYNSCQSGARSASYVNCATGLSNVSLNGSISLNYSNSICDISSVGDSVTRTYSLDLSGPYGGDLNISSASQTDYNGHTYGGGGKLTTTASGWNLDVLGRRTTLSFNGKTLMDVSVRTTSPLGITGSLSRASRVINSGAIEVNHNVAQFTGVFTPQNIQWSNSCCYPISGGYNVTWSGSKTGTATVTFQGCGQAQVNENGQTKNITLSYCE